jgi:hypothetical protein
LFIAILLGVCGEEHAPAMRFWGSTKKASGFTGWYSIGDGEKLRSHAEAAEKLILENLNQET